jgi:hypothetical protein
MQHNRVTRAPRYIDDTIAMLRKFEAEQSRFETSEGITALVRRAPYGVVGTIRVQLEIEKK